MLSFVFVDYIDYVLPISLTEKFNLDEEKLILCVRSRHCAAKIAVISEANGGKNDGEKLENCFSGCVTCGKVK